MPVSSRRSQHETLIAFATCAKVPDLTEEDRAVAAILTQRGLSVRPALWDDPGQNWSAYDAIILRSVWDYHLRAREFFEWLLALERQRVPLWNPVGLARWNMHKRYLRDLAARGSLIPDTEWVARGDARPLGSIMRARSWQRAIVKPAISASATATWIATGAIEDDRRYRVLVEQMDVLVQEVVAEVAEEGEWSVVFIDGAMSHTTIKKPAHGDFRVQVELGGSATARVAPDVVVAEARAIAGRIRGPWLYTRIDGVLTSRGFMLMEAECLEPVLFLEHAQRGHERFADAIQRVVSLNP